MYSSFPILIKNSVVKDIMHDPLFLAMRSVEAVKEDLPVAKDLTHTLKANADRWANMIGVRKRIIVFNDNGTYMCMFNPEIIKREQPLVLCRLCLQLQRFLCNCERSEYT